MKKSLFIGALSCALLLAGCGSGTEYAERKSLKPDVIAQNAKDLAKDDSLKNHGAIKSTIQSDFSINKVASVSYVNKGVVVTKNEQGYIGFFNLLTNKKITNNHFEEGFTTYSITSNEYVGFIIKIQYMGQTIVFDGLGNKLYEGEDFTSVSFETVDNNLFAVVTSDDSKIYQYGETAISTIDKIPNPQPEVDDDEEYFDFTHGQSYIDIQRISLKRFGHDGYHASVSGTLVSVFDTQEKVVSTFNIPTSGEFGIVGDYFLCQEVFTTSEMAEEYDYIQDSQKYTAHTYSINYMNGKRSDIETKYKLNSLTPFKDEDGNYKYGLANVQLIEAGKTLGTEFTYLMNSKLKFEQDVTGENLKNFSKLPNGYFYNTSTKILYSDKMDIVSYLSGINPSLDVMNGLFWGTMNGKIGALDLTGKVVIPFEYSEKISNVEDDMVYLKKQDGSYVKYNVTNGSVAPVNYDVLSLSKDLLLLTKENSDIYRYVKPSADIVSYTPVEGSTRSGTQVSLFLDNASFYIERISEPATFTADANYHIITFKGDPLRNYSKVSVYGTEKTEKICYGDTIDNAISIDLGTTTVINNPILGTYAAYYIYKNTLNEISRVALKFESGYQTVSNLKFRNESGNITTASYESTTSGEYIFNIPAKNELVFYIKATYQEMRTFTLTQVERGSSVSYPLEVTAGATKNISLSKGMPFYVKVTNLTVNSLYTVDPYGNDISISECAEVGFDIYGAFLAFGTSMTLKVISTSSKTISFSTAEKVKNIGNYAEDLHNYENLSNVGIGLYIYRNPSVTAKTMYLNCIFDGSHTITTFNASNNTIKTTYSESLHNQAISIPAGDVFVLYSADNFEALFSFSSSQNTDMYVTIANGFTEYINNQEYVSANSSGTKTLTFYMLSDATEFYFSYDFERYSSSEYAMILLNGVSQKTISTNASGSIYSLENLNMGDVITISYYKVNSYSYYYFNVYGIYAL